MREVSSPGQTMPDKPAAAAKISPATWIGLFLSLFGMLLVRQLVGGFCRQRAA
jgi:hypothetical protein